jgi:Tol biopolymer transport system component
LYDIKSGTPTRLTTSGKALLPSWTPDGLRILFMIGGVRGIMSQPVNGATGEIVPGTMSAFAPIATSDGQSVVFHRRAQGESNPKLWTVPLHGAGAPRRLTNDPVSGALMPAVSPNGRWVSYVLESESRRKEVYVRSFSDSGPAVKVSDGVGSEPAWSPDGSRIYYRGNGVLMAAAVSPASNTRAPALIVTSHTPQFKDASDNTMPHRNYDVLPDGGFLMVAPSKTGNPEAVLVLNWLTRLRQRLAAQP